MWMHRVQTLSIDSEGRGPLTRGLLNGLIGELLITDGVDKLIFDISTPAGVKKFSVSFEILESEVYLNDADLRDLIQTKAMAAGLELWKKAVGEA